MKDQRNDLDSFPDLNMHPGEEMVSEQATKQHPCCGAHTAFSIGQQNNENPLTIKCFGDRNGLISPFIQVRGGRKVLR